MLKNTYRVLIICLLVVVLTLIVATPALAFDTRTGDTVTIAVGEVVEGDLYLAASTIVIDGTVNGDVFAAGQSLTINGNINGGVSLAGQTITLNGKVNNGARLAAQFITVSSDIGRDLVVAGSQITIASTSQVHDDLMLYGDTVRFEGRVDGNMGGNANSITVTGTVGGNIDLTVNKLTMASSSEVKGNLKYTSSNEAVVQSGAKITGTTTHLPPSGKTTSWSLFPAMAGLAVVWTIFFYLMILLTGIIVILIARRRITLMASSIQSRPWQSLGWGALILVATPIVAIIVMISIIGIPLGLIALVLYGIALYLSQIPVGLLIGRLIIRQNRPIESRGLMIGALALGLLILIVLASIPVVGWIFGLATILLGLGALITASIKTEFKPVTEPPK